MGWEAGLRVYMPRGCDADNWESSREAWLPRLLREVGGKVGSEPIEFFVADVLTISGVEIEAEGMPTVDLPEGTNMIVAICDGEVADQGDTLAEIVERFQGDPTFWDFPVVVDLHCWRHHKAAAPCTFTPEEIECAREQIKREDAEAEASAVAARNDLLQFADRFAPDSYCSDQDE